MRPSLTSADTPPSRSAHLLRSAGLVVAGTLVMAAASWVEVPMVPVPMNMQSLAAPLLGVVMGSRLGSLAVLAWLLEACVGLPVLSGGAAGAHHLLGPTGGYLIAFPLAALACGMLWEHLRRQSFALAFGAMLLGNVMILGLGTAWLATFFGWQVALESGLYPFVLGALMKSLLGGGLVTSFRRWTAE